MDTLDLLRAAWSALNHGALEMSHGVQDAERLWKWGHLTDAEIRAVRKANHAMDEAELALFRAYRALKEELTEDVA